MPEITTGRLTDILMKSDLNGFPSYLEKYKNELKDFSFSDYFKKYYQKKASAAALPSATVESKFITDIKSSTAQKAQSGQNHLPLHWSGVQP
jgi:hypothetical protein